MPCSKSRRGADPTGFTRRFAAQAPLPQDLRRDMSSAQIDTQAEHEQQKQLLEAACLRRPDELFLSTGCLKAATGIGMETQSCCGPAGRLQRQVALLSDWISDARPMLPLASPADTYTPVNIQYRKTLLFSRQRRICRQYMTETGVGFFEILINFPSAVLTGCSQRKISFWHQYCL